MTDSANVLWDALKRAAAGSDEWYALSIGRRGFPEIIQLASGRCRRNWKNNVWIPTPQCVDRLLPLRMFFLSCVDKVLADAP